MTAKAYTFYSYKGGSGRTTTAVNTVKHLIEIMGASANNPILLVDADLESAGLTYFFNCEKRFTSTFAESIHTNKILEGAKFFDCENKEGRRLFGIANEEIVEISDDVKKAIIEILNKNFEITSKETVDNVFSGVCLSLKRVAMLRKIVSAVHSKAFPKVSEIGLFESVDEILNLYDSDDFEDLIRALISVDKTSLSNREKRETKENILNEFLPAVEFADVSNYYDCPKGTVKFLGVDVRFEEEQILRNGTERTIREFLEECGKQNFAAVVFDSGAGVQSSAHILHCVSDVLVYCMRPALQFIKGTDQQLGRYKKILTEIKDLKDPGKKSVILLPTAVPISSDNNISCRLNFNNILRKANAYTEFLDDSFCLTSDDSLNEVELFKWNECILGTSNSNIINETPPLKEYLSAYSNVETMPEDAKRAYYTYRKLATKLVENT